VGVPWNLQKHVHGSHPGVSGEGPPDWAEGSEMSGVAPPSWAGGGVHFAVWPSQIRGGTCALNPQDGSELQNPDWLYTEKSGWRSSMGSASEWT
jgi:hypothetical protein